MSTIDEIMALSQSYSDAQAHTGFHRNNARRALRDAVAAAIADARREGAEQMMAAAAAACEQIADEYNGSERHLYAEMKTDAITGASDCERAIRALPLPTGLRQAARHVGDSKFEQWFSMQSWSASTNKQHCRDSYAAGMGDGNG